MSFCIFPIFSIPISGCIAELIGNLSQPRKGRYYAVLYRQLALLRKDVPLTTKLNDLRWQEGVGKIEKIYHTFGDEQIPSAFLNGHRSTPFVSPYFLWVIINLEDHT
jgi:hypothetical protein